MSKEQELLMELEEWKAEVERLNNVLDKVYQELGNLELELAEEREKHVKDIELLKDIGYR